MTSDPAGEEGWRDRKRRETLRRITETALELFAAHGYEATTLDAIAAAAGISRRTFFHYFRSKEEILLAWQDGLPDAARVAVLAQAGAASALEAARGGLTALAARFNAEQAITIDRILRSTATLRASNLAKHLKVEQAVFEALCHLWPEPRQRLSLRMVAAASAAALRLAIDDWGEDADRRPLSDHVDAAFADLEAGLRTTRPGT